MNNDVPTQPVASDEWKQYPLDKSALGWQIYFFLQIFSQSQGVASKMQYSNSFGGLFHLLFLTIFFPKSSQGMSSKMQYLINHKLW